MDNWRDAARELFFRIAASGIVPARLFLPSVPRSSDLPARTGHLTLEIVTHCWRYEHLLAYQLSSLVLHPPSTVSVTMTVFHSREDRGTVGMLERFAAMDVPNVTWNWSALATPELMRRAIGRNRAALSTTADWIWFTDCDVVFHEGCLDGLAAELQGRRDLLVFPRRENVTPLLAPDDPMLSPGDVPVEIDVTRFAPRELGVAKGPVQITHGDLARRAGYCDAIALYQTPAPRWKKAWEDRAFRWLLRTDGVPIDVPGVYRIRHASKGRYGSRPGAAVRGSIRRFESWLRGSRKPGTR
ncbi:MAG: glycosyltransferase family 2 protein [Thermoanaerobaculia bacterium]